MNRFFVLFRNEEQRMLRYGITYASLGAALIWIIMIQLINIDSIGRYFPLFVFVDATMMSFLLVGAGMIFEKQENALKTLLVAPVSKHQYLLSKILASVFSSLLTLLILGAYGIIFKDLNINIAAIAGGVALAAFAFSCMGILFTYISRDFTTLLVWVIVFNLTLSIPTLLQALGIISADWVKYLQYVNPTQACLTVLNASVMKVEGRDLLISLVYLVCLSAAVYWLASARFDRFSIKEYGGD